MMFHLISLGLISLSCNGLALKANVYGQWNAQFGFKNALIWNKILSDVKGKTQFSRLMGLDVQFKPVFDTNSLYLMQQQETAQILFTVKGCTEENVSITFGPYNYCLHEPAVANAFNKPMFSQKCSDNRAAIYDTFIRLKPTSTDLSKALVATLSFFKWKKVFYLKPIAMVNDLSILSNAVEAEFQKNFIEYETGVYDNFVPPGPGKNYDLIPQVVLRSYLTTRIYVILSDDLASHTHFLLYLDHMGLLQTGEYAIVGIYSERVADYYSFNTTLNQNILYPTNILWLGVFRYSQSFAAYVTNTVKSLEVGVQWHRHFIGVIRSPPTSGQLDELQDAITFYQYNISAWPEATKLLGKLAVAGLIKISTDDILTYDTFALYAKAVASVSDRGIPLDNGKKIVESVTNMSHKSVAGYDFFVDSNGMTFGNVSFLYLKKTESKILPVGYFQSSPEEQWEYHGTQALDWIHSLPLDKPVCGFDGSECIFQSDETWKWATTGCIVAFAFVSVVAAFFLRQWMYERKLQLSLWKIASTELSLQEHLNGSLNSIRSLGSGIFSVAGSQASVKMLQSHLALKTFEDNIMKEVKKKSRLSKKKSKKEIEAEGDKFAKITGFSVALYKSNLVGLKRVRKTHVDFSRDVKVELKQMCDTKHDNLCGFIGALVEPNLIFIISDFCPRGCLKDMLENDVIQLDHMFISSIVFDIIKGILFLHHSEIKRHGNLKSTNCLVDSRWVIKLSGFGLHKFKSGQQGGLSEEETAKKLLWTAPELLSNPEKRHMGTQKGDAYSFGIILFEIFGRNGPFGALADDYSEIVEKVRHSTESSPFRPDVKTIENLARYASETMQACWAQDPLKRPTFTEIKRQLKPLSKGLKSNIFDNMLAMMEKYTNNLEEIVAERTKQLDEERKKSEKLLLMMLPKSVAEKLKSGQPVEAETFDSVSIYFSDIVGFTSMSSDSTPMQVVAFLNDLYTCFDSIIGHYDVYKVETIGDAYMVVSGLPVKNGNNHAGEIASMSLNLLKEIKVFKVRHRPNETLKLRIGIHSGSVVSGVVGLKMPRYCLFGDTVNTASRMESNGEALKIHCSSPCKAILDNLGGYDVVERGLVAMKGKGELLTYWVIDEDREIRRKRIAEESRLYPNLKKEMI